MIFVDSQISWVTYKEVSIQEWCHQLGEARWSMTTISLEYLYNYRIYLHILFDSFFLTYSVIWFDPEFKVTLLFPDRELSAQSVRRYEPCGAIFAACDQVLWDQRGKWLPGEFSVGRRSHHRWCEGVDGNAEWFLNWVFSSSARSNMIFQYFQNLVFQFVIPISSA